MKWIVAGHWTALRIAAFVVPQATLFFRRDRNRPTRADAYRDLFSSLESLYESAARLRPEWRDLWRDRRTQPLPPKYESGDEMTTNAVHDMRYATWLLQRYRWKSVVKPLFEDIDEPAWSRFSATASDISPSLLALSDAHLERLREDEIDWINTAVEQFDEATRRRRRLTDTDAPRAQQVAEGVYQPIYIAIHLSDRLIERLRYEASQR
ncbi:MAG TPA: hypothetical protein VFV93_04735 [Thermomicrobiales bacterium]|nr:hypothetical protein [Thermomicrobiales bacterium]